MEGSYIMVEVPASGHSELIRLLGLEHSGTIALSN